MTATILDVLLKAPLPSVDSVAPSKLSKNAVTILNLQSERNRHLLKQTLRLDNIVPVALKLADQRRLSLDAPTAFRHVPIGKLKAPEGGPAVCSQIHSGRETSDCRRGS
jgi:hypothetical protein